MQVFFYLDFWMREARSRQDVCFFILLWYNLNMKIAKTQLKQIAQKHNINTVYLFGSQAAGKAHPGSDYDFAVQFKKEVKPAKYFDLKLKLMRDIGKLAESDKIDIVVLNDIKAPLVLKFRIIKEGKILYADDDIARSRMEHKIMSYYLDRQYYFKRHIDASLKNIAAHGIL